MSTLEAILAVAVLLLLGAVTLSLWLLRAGTLALARQDALVRRQEQTIIAQQKVLCAQQQAVDHAAQISARTPSRAGGGSVTITDGRGLEFEFSPN